MPVIITREERCEVGKSKHRTMTQHNQSMKDESEQAQLSLANTMPTFHKDKHAPNRPSNG
ncbi:hypothetical protein ACFO9Q_16175 [Paenibacillus sp. GCM10023252]|uniref:hypothetical protein n=1 Tax=Paenibacillus sp. GCM10023252 TaxID=3252649 RepID=UPI003614BCD3